MSPLLLPIKDLGKEKKGGNRESQVGIHVHLCRSRVESSVYLLIVWFCLWSWGHIGTATPWENPPALGRRVDASLQATHLLDAWYWLEAEMASCNPPTPTTILALVLKVPGDHRGNSYRQHLP